MLSDLYKLIKNLRVYVIMYMFHMEFLLAHMIQNYRKVYHFNENGIYTDDSLVISSYELQKYQEYNDYLELEKKANEIISII